MVVVVIFVEVLVEVTPLTDPVLIGKPPLVVLTVLSSTSGLAEVEGVGVGEIDAEGDVEGAGFRLDINLVVALKV